MGKNKRIWVYVVAMVSITLWGLSYIWSDSLIRLGIPVEYFVFVRVVIAGFILLVFNLIRKANIRIAKKDLPVLFTLALCEPLIYFVCETYGIKLTESPTYSALIIASTPVFSVFAGVLFFREKMNMMNIIGILVCLGGLVMVTLCATSVGEYFIFGVILLMIAVFAEVGHASCVKALASKYDPGVIVMYQFLIGAVMLFPLFITRGVRDFTPEVYLAWDVWKPVLYLSVLCSSIAFSLWASAIKNLGVAKSSIFLAMIPIVTALSGFIAGTEILSVLQWMGIAVACLGLILTQYVKKNRA